MTSASVSLYVYHVHTATATTTKSDKHTYAAAATKTDKRTDINISVIPQRVRGGEAWRQVHGGPSRGIQQVVRRVGSRHSRLLHPLPRGGPPEGRGGYGEEDWLH